MEPIFLRAQICTFYLDMQIQNIKICISRSDSSIILVLSMAALHGVFEALLYRLSLFQHYEFSVYVNTLISVIIFLFFSAIDNFIAT